MGARFVRLGIAGFKSFADAAQIEILPGLTGIVGPNGCGKSNVAEALRWAMGESNARTLRGGEMDDVIFAGTSNRASRNLAEVTLSVEGDEDGLPPPFAANSELQITRRIDRGSGSLYRVNGREARARDVQTLFADLASGARSSAMVSQGRVSALVNARPEERRAVLEEAAGITGLHARRAEAETRLRAAELNLEKAEERRVLLEKQLSGLQAQADQASRYRRLVEGVGEAEAALLGIQRDRAASAMQKAELAVSSARQSLDHATVQARAAATHAASLQAQLPGLREAEATARSQLDRARIAQEGVAAEAERARSALTAATQRKAQIERDVAHARSTLADSAGADERLQRESDQLRQACLDHPKALSEAQLATAAAAQGLADADQVATEAAAAAAAASTRSDASRQVLQQAEAAFRRSQGVLERLDAEHSRAASQIVDPEKLAATMAAAETTEQARERARLRLEEAESERVAALAASGTARTALSASEATRVKLAAEAGAIAEFLAIKDGERWTPMIDRLQVPAGLEAALGAVLGEELGAADNAAAPRHWRALEASESPPLPCARMDEAIGAPPLLARALGGIGIVGSSQEGDAAQRLLQPGQSLVSREGGVWRWDGYTILGGTPTAAAVRLRQRNRLATVTTALRQAESDSTAARQQHQGAASREATAERDVTNARAARRDSEAAAERAATTARAMLASSEQASARLTALTNQRNEAAPEAAAARIAVQAAQDAVAALPDAAALRTAFNQARDAVTKARAADSAAQRLLDGMERAERDRQHRLTTIVREREDRASRALDLASRVTDLEARMAEATVEHATLAGTPARAEQAAVQAGIAVREATLAAEAAGARRVTTESQASAADEAARSSERAVFEAREQIARAESQHDAAAIAVQEVASRIADRGESLPALPAPTPDPSPTSEDRARQRLARLARERDEIGPVNLRAEIEAATVVDAVQTIEREREELGTAIAKLRGSIGHLNREGRERLTAVFNQVDRHFQSLFARMFGGGRAHLAMIGSDDPLLAGLEIYAQPPGKKLTALSLLSGGEQALTALSLVFAVFRCNPAPLCVLDEVDAPLDDANVERFCTLLADMVQETGTRFLVVTHHQVTMARMDRLYGVTMQERGVSRLLSVDLSRALGMTEAIAAE